MTVCVLLFAAACGEEGNLGPAPCPDPARFSNEVYGILLTDCGFPACHGDSGRLFQVYGPGRTRIDPDTPITAPPTAFEIEATYDRARSMVSLSDPTQSLLLRRPLEGSAGGGGHSGVDAFGRNIYPSTSDPRYQVIEAWAFEAPACGETIPTTETFEAILSGEQMP